MDYIISIAIAVVPSVLSGAVLLKLSRTASKSDAREKARVEENILILGNLDAIGTLADRTARCVKGEKVNGELDEAITYRIKKKHDLETHLIKVNAELKGR